MANNYSRKTREILKEAGVIKNPKDIEGREIQIIKEAREEKAIKTMTLQNRLFLNEWLKTGNALLAYKKVYRVKQDYRAIEQSAIIIAKYKSTVVLAMREKLGINEALYFERLMILLKAKKTIFSKFGGKHIIPDNQTRLKALQMLGELLRVNGEAMGKGGVNTAIGTVNIFKDREAGVFSVSDFVDGEVIR
jgi:hypothetical protein